MNLKEEKLQSVQVNQTAKASWDRATKLVLVKLTINTQRYI
jgi:hypothetical protein